MLQPLAHTIIKLTDTKIEQVNNSKVMQTMIKATRNIYVCSHNAVRFSDETIKEFLPKNITTTTLSLKTDFQPIKDLLVPQPKTYVVYMSKNTTGLFACFSKKIKRKQLLIYDHSIGIYDEQTHDLQCYLDFKIVNIRIKRKTKEIFLLVQNGGQQDSFYIETDSEQLTDQLDQTLDLMIKKSSTSTLSKKYLCSIPNYQKYATINFEQFQKTCNSGDILLVKKRQSKRRKSSISIIPKNSTNLEMYQHVALIIRNANNQILILQKNNHNSYRQQINQQKAKAKEKEREKQKEKEKEKEKEKNKQKQKQKDKDKQKGKEKQKDKKQEQKKQDIQQIDQKQLIKTGKIGINYWLNILNREWYLNFQKIAYRKLQVERDQKFYSSLQKQIIKILDKQYDTQIRDVYKIQPQTTLKTFQQQSAYQCCDFIAQLYSKIGLTNISRQSIQFWPIDFTTCRQFPFTHGKFGTQLIINFSPNQPEILQVEQPK